MGLKTKLLSSKIRSRTQFTSLQSPCYEPPCSLASSSHAIRGFSRKMGELEQAGREPSLFSTCGYKFVNRNINLVWLVISPTSSLSHSLRWLGLTAHELPERMQHRRLRKTWTLPWPHHWCHLGKYRYSVEYTRKIRLRIFPLPVSQDSHENLFSHLFIHWTNICGTCNMWMVLFCMLVIKGKQHR